MWASAEQKDDSKVKILDMVYILWYYISCCKGELLCTMDERLRQTLLYDFYGELLNDHQKNVFSAAVFDDMNYSEISEEFGCSRQAAFDLVKRINRKLENYEERLGLLKRFMSVRDRMNVLGDKIEDIEKYISETDLSNKEINTINKKLDDILAYSKEIVEDF